MPEFHVATFDGARRPLLEKVARSSTASARSVIRARRPDGGRAAFAGLYSDPRNPGSPVDDCVST